MAEPITPQDEQPTEQIGPAQTLLMEVAPKPRRRRHWLGRLVVIVIVIVVLLIVFFVGDALARQYATGLVREQIVTALKLDPGADVTVDLGDGSILLQAATGSLDDLSVHVSQFSLGDVRGEAQITATDVPIDTSKPLGTMAIEVTVDQANVQALAGFLSGVDLTSIELRDNLIRISTELDIGFAQIPVSVDLAPSAKDGGITFEPITVLLGEQQVTVADLRAIPGIGDLASSLLGSRSVCVASYLPQALAIDDVKVVGTDLLVSIKGDGAALSGPGLSTMGTCPAA